MVFHDPQGIFPVVAASQAVQGVCQSVQVQSPGGRRQQRHQQGGAGRRRQALIQPQGGSG